MMRIFYIDSYYDGKNRYRVLDTSDYDMIKLLGAYMVVEYDNMGAIINMYNPQDI